MIIVSGRIFVHPSHRDAFLERARDAMTVARRTPGCLDFVVAADPVEPDRVNVYEAWQSEASLEAFRGEGPGGDITSMVVRADVARHRVESSGPA